MNPVVHFQLPYEDADRVSKFYSKAFGWQTEKFGPDGQYIMANTVETDKKTGRPTKPGAINGGFFKMMDDPKSRLMNVVIAVDDIEEGMNKVRDAGGLVDGKPQAIPQVGKFVMFTDPEGNRVCMLEPQM